MYENALSIYRQKTCCLALLKEKKCVRNLGSALETENLTYFNHVTYNFGIAFRV